MRTYAHPPQPARASAKPVTAAARPASAAAAGHSLTHYSLATADPHNAPVQRDIADDLRAMDMGHILDFVSQSDRARALIAKANERGVSILRGGWGGAQTAREHGTGRITVSLPPRGADHVQSAQDFIFELHNALRQDRFDALRQQAAGTGILDEDEFARKKMQIEIEGMVGTGKVASELRTKGMDIPQNRFFTAAFQRYAIFSRQHPGASLEAFTEGMANEVLDLPHAQGSHRQVYRDQFRALANPANQQARADHPHVRLAGQIGTMSRVIGRDAAIDKVWLTHEGRATGLVDYLSRHSDSAPHAELRHHMMRGLADRLNGSLAEEPALLQNRGLMASLHSWVEGNDDGRYRNLSQVLGLSLGYYERHPEHLRQNIY